MPRSYSFDHFTVAKTEQPVPERGRRKTKKATNGGGQTDIRYGKAHAQTEELYQAHMMQAQLEELAGVDKEPPRMSKAQQASSDDADPIDRLRKSAPIGANPTAELPGKFKVRDVWSDGMRHVRLMRDGARDVLMAAGYLWRMPRDVMRALLRRERHA